MKSSNVYVYIRTHMSPPALYFYLHSLKAANEEFCYGSEGVDGGLPQPPHRPVLQVARRYLYIIDPHCCLIGPIIVIDPQSHYICLT